MLLKPSVTPCFCSLLKARFSLLSTGYMLGVFCLFFSLILSWRGSYGWRIDCWMSHRFVASQTPPLLLAAYLPSFVQHGNWAKSLRFLAQSHTDWATTRSVSQPFHGYFSSTHVRLSDQFVNSSFAREASLKQIRFGHVLCLSSLKGLRVQRSRPI